MLKPANRHCCNENFIFTAKQTMCSYLICLLYGCTECCGRESPATPSSRLKIPVCDKYVIWWWPFWRYYLMQCWAAGAGPLQGERFSRRHESILFLIFLNFFGYWGKLWKQLVHRFLNICNSRFYNALQKKKSFICQWCTAVNLCRSFLAWIMVWIFFLN